MSCCDGGLLHMITENLAPITISFRNPNLFLDPTCHLSLCTGRFHCHQPLRARTFASRRACRHTEEPLHGSFRHWNPYALARFPSRIALLAHWIVCSPCPGPCRVHRAASFVRIYRRGGELTHATRRQRRSDMFADNVALPPPLHHHRLFNRKQNVIGSLSSVDNGRAL